VLSLVESEPGIKVSRQPKVAIVHDWLIGGGAERVVEALHEMYPKAPIYTSYATAEWQKKLNGKVVSGYLQKWPFSKLRKFIPFLRIQWFSSLNFDGYDLVISTSGAEAKGIKTGPNTIHVNYCHAPTHYYWSRYEQYLQRPGFGFFDPIARLGLKVLVGPLRRWDYKAAQRPDHIIANSTYIQQQVKKYYGRDSTVIFPPVDTTRFNSSLNEPRSGFVIAGRQTPYKRVDLAVSAFTKLNLPLIVIGKGPDHKKLRAAAGPTITFVTNALDKDVAQYFQRAEAFIFPGLDDFGITPVEAMAAGAAVIAYKAGGAIDYVIPGKTGLFFDQQTSKSLETAIKKFKPEDFSTKTISKEANNYSVDTFKSRVSMYLATLS